jgi:hypothetical protein
VASTLVATVVTYGPLDDGVEHVGWSQDGAEGDHFLLMRNLEDQVGYCLLANDATHYGGVQAVEVSEGETRLFLSAEAATALGTETEVILQYPPRIAEASQLQSGPRTAAGGLTRADGYAQNDEGSRSTPICSSPPRGTPDSAGSIGAARLP